MMLFTKINFCKLASSFTILITLIFQKRTHAAYSIDSTPHQYVSNLFLKAGSMSSHDRMPRVAVIGSGNFGSIIAKIISSNIVSKYCGINNMQDYSRCDMHEVKMWVFDELLEDGRLLSDVINNDHVNTKYLPEVKLPTNLRAVTNLVQACKDCNILIFVTPQKFLQNILKQLKGHVAPDTLCVSLVKGIGKSTNTDKSQPQSLQLSRYSEIIKKELGVSSVAVAMGANVAKDIAAGIGCREFAEITVACDCPTNGDFLASILSHDNLKVQKSRDVASVELLGALKNVVAIGAGFCDGLGFGCSSKAVIIRRGLLELGAFCKLSSTEYSIETSLLLSCGLGDIVASSIGGRNRKCAEEFVRRRLKHKSLVDMNIIWDQIESDLLGGQQLQGIETLRNLYEFLDFSNILSQFPLFHTLFKIACLGDEPKTLFKYLSE